MPAGARTRKRQPVPILLYHSIDTQGAPDYRRWITSPSLFDEHMSWLAENKYRPLAVSTLVGLLREDRSPPPRTVVITFDDGLRDFLIGAMPSLQRHGFPATLYVVTGYVGRGSEWLSSIGEGGRPMLCWDELRALSAHGIECGAHSDTHPQLDILSPSAALADIRRSKAALEDQLNHEVVSFAYPHGYASRTTRRLVREAGFASACRVRHAVSATDEDLFALSRIIMTSVIRPADLEHLLAGVGMPVAPRPDRLGSGTWRLVRRLKQAAKSSGSAETGPEAIAQGALGVSQTDRVSPDITRPMAGGTSSAGTSRAYGTG
jgi:peptidoglycan/xylan/chitin deacetylase (PgdA/CDA1 family)